MANNHMDRKFKRNDLTFYSISKDKYEITYWDNNNDKPVLLMIHGFGTWSKFQWSKQIKDLGKEYRLILPNLLHFGKSTCNGCGYQVADQVKAMELLIGELKLDNILLAGASYGGVVASELALTRLDKIDKLMIIAGPVKFYTPEDVETVKSTFEVSSVNELLVTDNYKGLKRVVSEVLYENAPFAPTFMFKDIYNEMFGPFTGSMNQVLDALVDQQAYFEARSYPFEFPILLLWGRDDPLVFLHVGEKLNEYFEESSRLEIIDETRHMPILEKHKSCNKIILEFLAE